MADVEYCVQVSNKYALFEDDAPDPSELFQQLAASKAALLAAKEDKMMVKKAKESTIGKKPTNQDLATTKQRPENVDSNTAISAKQGQMFKTSETSKTGVKIEETNQQRKDDNSARSDRSGRGSRRGRGGPRGGGGNLDQENNENRRPRNPGVVPPRMTNIKRGGAEFGAGNNDFGQGGNDNVFGSRQEDKFGDRFGEAPRERGGGRPGRGRGRNLRRGGLSSRNDGGGFNNDNFGGGGFNNSNEFGSVFGGGNTNNEDNQSKPSGGGGFGTGFGGGFASANENAPEMGVFGGHFESPSFGAGGGNERGRGRGRGGSGRFRGRGAFGGRGRQFDRQSGSDRSGVKSMDKREGGGSHNWGNTGDEIGTAVAAEGEESTPAVVAEEEEQRDTHRETEEGDAAATPEKNEPAELTYDEWKALQGPRNKPSFNVRRPGEGENDKKEWKVLVPLAREKKGDKEEDEELEFVEDEERPRKTHTVPIQINFIDEAARGGSGGGRGGPRGGFRGRGGGRGFGSDEFGGGNRSRGTGFGGGFNRGFGGERRGPARPSAPYKMDDETFPSLAKNGPLQ